MATTPNSRWFTNIMILLILPFKSHNLLAYLSIMTVGGYDRVVHFLISRVPRRGMGRKGEGRKENKERRREGGG